MSAHKQSRMEEEEEARRVEAARLEAKVKAKRDKEAAKAQRLAQRMGSVHSDGT